MPRPSTNTPQGAATRPAASPAAPPAIPNEPEDELDETATGDDTPPGSRPAPPPRREDDDESLFATAKRNLGLPADASPTDLLRAIAGAGAAALRPVGPPRAACKLVTVVDGKRLVIEPDALIPDGVDLTKLPPHSVKGR